MRGQDTMKRVTFYGHEKNETTARLAQINLAVHGLQGTIRAGNEAITYYKDPHELVGKCDFVMANPPFNVDEVDAEKVKGDKRLPFGLPGVNKAKKVSNANYLWISYFYSYLNENGRAGFVMSSQASSAGRDEATVRQKLVETGAVDVMIDIRGNFFYTRTVPCQLWFFDRAKEKDEARRDHVLMLDARQHLPQGLALGLRFLARAAEEHRRHRLALSRAAGALPEAGGSLSGEAVALGERGATAAGSFRRSARQARRPDGAFREDEARRRSAGRAVGRTHQRAGHPDGGYRSLRQGSGGAGQGMGQGGARQCRAERRRGRRCIRWRIAAAI